MQESLAEKTLLLALSALLDTKSKEARVWKGIRPEYGNNPMMKKEASMEDSRNPNPTNRQEAKGAYYLAYSTYQPDLFEEEVHLISSLDTIALYLHQVVISQPVS